MGASRRGEREPGKSDQIDARAIARAVLREGIERFPTAFLDQDAAEIRLLCDHRDTLVNERTRLINRLRINLVVLDPELEAKIPTRKLDYPGQLQRITRRLRTMPQTARVRVAREQVKRIATLTREAEVLKRELRDLIRLHRPELLAEAGCGPLCAAILIGKTAGAERFKSDAHFARVAGVAPIPVSSGRHDRHRLDRGGNRQLNRALHVIAITRGRIDPQTRAYLQRKEAEGKSRIEAMRCLKRTSPARTIGCSVNDRDQRVLSHKEHIGRKSTIRRCLLVVRYERHVAPRGDVRYRREAVVGYGLVPSHALGPLAPSRCARGRHTVCSGAASGDRVSSAKLRDLVE
jgi:transposase